MRTPASAPHGTRRIRALAATGPAVPTGRAPSGMLAVCAVPECDTIVFGSGACFEHDVRGPAPPPVAAISRGGPATIRDGE